MATPRRILGEVSVNRVSGTELSPFQRGQIIGAAKLGCTTTEISTALNHPPSTIRTTISRDEIRNDGESNLREGRPNALTIRQERIVIRFVRTHPKYTYAQVLLALGFDVHVSTLKRVLKKYGISNWKAKRRPYLSAKDAKARLKWCKERRNWTIEEWAIHMWSDECSAERGRGKVTEWCFGYIKDKWKREYIQTYSKEKGLSVMVWGCFWGAGRSELFILNRDFASKKHGYSTASYVEVLDDQLPKCWQPGMVFMQDNASIHTSRGTTQWFQDIGIPLLPWPPYSPDLNPIEHVWWHLKKKVVETHPEFTDLKGKSEEDVERMANALKEAWDSLPKSLFDSLYKSMPNRIAACIKAKGWHTKY
jgi:transposase